MTKLEYNIIINTGDKSLGKDGYITYHKVSSVEKFRKFAFNKYPNWKFATVYNKLTRVKLEVIKP